ncbi:MAG: rod shape-determining protein MreC [Endomicrobiaceae bacterium]|nr:rod shape-determining protein MreC [Endomicrobiaceae bacterium]
MTKNNDKFNKDTNKVFFVLILLSLLFIFARISQPVSILRNLTYHFLMPSTQFTSDSFSSSNKFITNISNIFHIYQENIKLHQQIVLLTEQLRDYQSVTEENIKLKNLLSIPIPKKTELLFANIIIREPSQWYKWLIISKGQIDGIKKDMSVVTIMKDNKICVIGKTAEVYDTTTKIALITNSLFAVPVQIKNSDIDCLIEGTDSEYLKLMHVPQSSKLNINDEIVTGPLSSVFSQDIPVGQIAEITKTPYGDYAEILVLPYIQKQRIHEVAVIIPKEENN